MAGRAPRLQVLRGRRGIWAVNGLANSARKMHVFVYVITHMHAYSIPVKRVWRVYMTHIYMCIHIYTYMHMCLYTTCTECMDLTVVRARGRFWGCRPTSRLERRRSWGVSVAMQGSCHWVRTLCICAYNRMRICTHVCVGVYIYTVSNCSLVYAMLNNLDIHVTMWHAIIAAGSTIEHCKNSCGSRSLEAPTH